MKPYQAQVRWVAEDGGSATLWKSSSEFETEDGARAFKEKYHGQLDGGGWHCEVRLFFVTPLDA